ncbi:MAG TPA: PAS domain-containing protein [Ferrovibrio sp.]|uniref:PAS domain-containing protein n=1 Tax=Ferrovibrio sp. TaxID=1917215 RepID=UPI002ED65247
MLLNLAAYWAGKRSGGRLPPRRAIDPLDMPRRLLPFLTLAEPVGDGVVRFRLIGTELTQRAGRDDTGKTSAETLSGSYRDYIESLYATVAAEARPLYVETVQAWPEEGMSRIRRLLLPVTRDDLSGDVAFVLGAQSFGPAPETPGRQRPPMQQQLIAVEALEKGVLQATFRGLLDPP